MPASAGRVSRRGYALKVQGDSMIDEHICDGTLHHRDRTKLVMANSVALLREQPGEFERRFRRGKNIELNPANPLQPLTVPART